MESQSSLFIQSNAGLRPEIPRQSEKSRDSKESLSESFKNSLNESIVDVYERSDIKTAVPNERSGVDRRTSAPRRKPSLQSVSFTTGEIDIQNDVNITKQTYVATGKDTSDFSSLQKKGNFLDTWA
jgi:hypothetical protein